MFILPLDSNGAVDFEPGGVGGELLESIGMPPLPGEALPGYVAWLPDRTVTLYRDGAAWAEERLRALGNTPAHRRLWSLLDRLAAAFWNASRNGMKLPIQSPRDILRAVRAIGLPSLPLTRYASWTLGDALRTCGLRQDKPLVALLSMLVEDTVHSAVNDAPPGHRAVMLSTHCELADWEGLTEAEYTARKAASGAQLIALAQRVYPELGRRALFQDIGTPRTYAHFTHRPRGAVGGVRQNLGNANQNAVPYSLGAPGFWLVGDTTWPGLGTVACVLGSRLVAEGVRRTAPRPNCPLI